MNRTQKSLLFVGIGLVTIAIIATRWPGLSNGWVRFWDNVHWTLGYSFAAVLAWTGVRQAEGQERATRRWFAWGLSLYALGQVLWDLQVLSGWNPFPGPSDLFFLLLGVCLIAGLALPGKTLQGRRRWTFSLDLLGVALVTLGLSLALFLQHFQGQGWVVILTLSAYPVLLTMAVAAGLTALLAHRWRMDRWMASFLLAVLVQDALWFEWNRRTLISALGDGVLLNYGFSYTALWLGACVAQWAPSPRQDEGAERPYFLLSNLAPLLVALGAGLAFALGLSAPMPAPTLVGALALLAMVLVVLRQSLTLLEHDSLRVSEQRYHALMLDRAAVQRVEGLGSLAGGIAHDFNNILAVVSAEAELLRGSDAGSGSNGVDKIVRATERGRDLVQRISTYAQPERGIQAQAVDLGQAVEQALLLLRPLLPRSVELLAEAPPEPLAVLSDVVQMQQMLINLGINAGQALGDAGGRVAFSWRPIASGANDPAWVELQVSDNGPGIDPAILPRIFDPFTTKDPGKGTGLGLAIVQSMVTNAGGRVVCESRPGEGAHFFVTLPRAIASGAQAEAQPTAVGLPRAEAKLRDLKLGTVLVVDDEKDLGQALAQMLERIGWKALACTDPEQALALLKADPGRFVVLVSDKTMPGMGGYELLEKAKALKPGLTTILMSGYDDPVKGPAVDGFLAKPFGSAELATLFQELL